MREHLTSPQHAVSMVPIMFELLDAFVAEDLCVLLQQQDAAWVQAVQAS